VIQTRQPSASPRLHPMDCRCSKCPDPRGTREHRHARFLLIFGAYLLVIGLGVIAILKGAGAL
jgi:hypothetical protein